MGISALALLALLVRLLLIDQRSAFLDEGSYILTGRYLIEERAIYAYALDWIYGSYLWPIMAGAADIAGGLLLVRALTAFFSMLAVIATVVTTFHLAPLTLAPARRWTVALIAGAIMALAPTAIATGRLGTYDSLAFAAFMGGIALLAAARRKGGRLRLLGAAILLFTGFLAKYLVAVYFPPLCLYLLLSPLVGPARDWRASLRNLVWCVVPLSLACLAYFLAFRAELLNLIAYATTSTVVDLKSPQPLREYVFQRADVWLLAGIAALGLPRATRSGRVVAIGGVATIAAFHAASRADYDWWKHSVYAIFFLAPLAALALTPVAAFLTRSALAAFGWARATGTERVVALGCAAAVVLLQVRLWSDFGLWRPAVVAVFLLAPLAGLALAPLAERMLTGENPVRRAVVPRALAAVLAAGIVMPGLIHLTLARSDALVGFYPNLKSSQAAIEAHASGARTVLTDDGVLRHILYPIVPSDPNSSAITGPDWVSYEGHQEMEGYRRGIADRWWDVIVLDGGLGPFAARLRQELGDFIPRYYERVYSHQEHDGTLVEIFRPRQDELEVEPSTADANIHTFERSPGGWGGRPKDGDHQAGLQAEVSEERAFRGRPALKFTTNERVSLLNLRVKGPVRRVRAHLYISPEVPSIRIGMIGFDSNWQWRDDGFQHELPTGRWVTVAWELAEPGVYNEIGLAFPEGEPRAVYIGQVEIWP